MSHEPKDYVAIALWGHHLASSQYYIDDQQALAAQDEAPVDALYERGGKWVCVSDLKEGHHFREVYERALAETAKKIS